MQIKWPTGCSVSFQTGLKMCSLPFTRVFSVADLNTPVQYGIHPQCKTSRNWNPPNVLSSCTCGRSSKAQYPMISTSNSTITTLSRSIYDHSFVVRGPKLWNAIPKNIKCAPSFEVFKSKLTSHIMSIIPDLPPVPGYTTPNSYSILDWNAGGLQLTTGGLVGSSTEADKRYKR